MRRYRTEIGDEIIQKMPGYPVGVAHRSSGPRVQPVMGAVKRLVIEERFPGMDSDTLHAWWTEPGRLAGFWAGEAETDLRVGGRYRLSWPSLQRTLRGTHFAVGPGRRLEFTWDWVEEPEATERTVAMTFVPGDEGAAPIITQFRYGDSPSDAEAQRGHRAGWEHFCESLRRVAGS
jgi:uncharacterized protein YndB with AHSA1/START domain